MVISKLEFEGEYLNGERNGKGKEYNYNGDIIFEGEYYKNKKWEGKGYDNRNNIIYELKEGKGLVKEYFDGKLRFEGEYLNGLINGKVKEYYPDGKLKFKGEYLNCERNGKGKEYNYNGELIFRENI